MEWVLASPYMKSEKNMDGSLWKRTECLGDIEFNLVKARYDHNRSRSRSSLTCWYDYWLHANEAWDLAVHNNSGIITCFPQLPAIAGLRKRISGSSIPIVAWTFNLGVAPEGVKKSISKFALERVDKIIVHSTYEKHFYAKHFSLPEKRFEFVPLHRNKIVRSVKEDKDKPFLLSMGTANRDYSVLFKAVERLGYPLVVVASAASLRDLAIPSNVKVLSNLSLNECRTLCQQAKINIVPVDNVMTASGQVTIVEAMMFGATIIATDTIGSRDYLSNEITGLLIKNKSVEELESAIKHLWENEEVRERLSTNASNYAHNFLTQEKASEMLRKVLVSTCN